MGVMPSPASLGETRRFTAPMDDQLGQPSLPLPVPLTLSQRCNPSDMRASCRLSAEVTYLTLRRMILAVNRLHPVMVRITLAVNLPGGGGLFCVLLIHPRFSGCYCLLFIAPPPPTGSPVGVGGLVLL